MHPGFFGWWKHARGQGGGCGSEAQCGPGQAAVAIGRARFAATKAGKPAVTTRVVRRSACVVRCASRVQAGLDEKQVGELARVLSDLKTERAQAAVDSRRAVTALADVVASDSFDAGKATAVAADRARSPSG